MYHVNLYCSDEASLNLIGDSIRRRENEAWRDNASRRTDTNARPLLRPRRDHRGHRCHRWKGIFLRY